ncbi:MAG: sugar phosphate isomerase/epimerase [Mucilaginibacter sp.]
MQIKYTCTSWGYEKLDAAALIDKIVDAGYGGIEVNMPVGGAFPGEFMTSYQALLKSKPGFIFIVQQLVNPDNESVEAYIHKLEKRLLEVVAYQPHFINSHTGKDHYSFDDNCRAIEAALNISAKTGMRILHETHRGRFSFHASTLLPYLEKFPEMELVGDFSHFCTVSESMLDDQQAILDQIISHVAHLHARVGSEQAPQVNDPFAPEWASHLERFAGWWDQIIAYHQSKGAKEFTITPEFGPAPYMPVMAFTQKPLSDQWATNLKMRDFLTRRQG